MSKTVNQPTAMPTRKVMAYTGGSVVGAIVMRLLDHYFGFGLGNDAIIGVGLPMLVGGLSVSWFIRDRPNV